MPLRRPAIPGVPSITMVCRARVRTGGLGKRTLVRCHQTAHEGSDVTRVPATSAEKASGDGDAGRLIEWRI